MSDVSNGRGRKIKIYSLTLRNLLIAHFEGQQTPEEFQDPWGWGGTETLCS